jgi:hypothetical protein
MLLVFLRPIKRGGVNENSSGKGGEAMRASKYLYWQDDGMWLGYMEEYPDYWTQGETIDEYRFDSLSFPQYNEVVQSAESR